MAHFFHQIGCISVFESTKRLLFCKTVNAKTLRKKKTTVFNLRLKTEGKLYGTYGAYMVG